MKAQRKAILIRAVIICAAAAEETSEASAPATWVVGNYAYMVLPDDTAKISEGL